MMPIELKEIETIESQGEINHSKDIIFELLKGRHIFQGSEFSELKQNHAFYEKIFALVI